MTPATSRQGVGEALTWAEREPAAALAEAVAHTERRLSEVQPTALSIRLDPKRIRLILSALSSQAEALEAMAGALEPVALLAADDETKGVNMHDPISKWLTIANLQRASEALSQHRQTKEDPA